MYALHIHSVVRKIDDVPFVGWVLFLKTGGQTKIDLALDQVRSTVEPQLADRRINFSEITTNDGRQEVYRKFRCGRMRRPLFLILHKHPTDYKANDSFVVIEWGKWNTDDHVQEDLLQFIDYFSQQRFEDPDVNEWLDLKSFLKEYDFERLRLGKTISIHTMLKDVKSGSSDS